MKLAIIATLLLNTMCIMNANAVDLNSMSDAEMLAHMNSIYGTVEKAEEEVEIVKPVQKDVPEQCAGKTGILLGNCIVWYTDESRRIVTEPSVTRRSGASSARIALVARQEAKYKQCKDQILAGARLAYIVQGRDVRNILGDWAVSDLIIKNCAQHRNY